MVVKIKGYMWGESEKEKGSDEEQKIIEHRREFRLV
jgi:hypothetical protein